MRRNDKITHLCGHSVFVLTHLPKDRDKWNWIQTSENHERICLNGNLAFGQVQNVGEKI